MKQWKYKAAEWRFEVPGLSDDIPAARSRVIDWLNSHGEKGWEIVEIFRGPNSMLVTFKQERIE